MPEDAVEHYAGTVQNLLSFYWRFTEFWPQTKTITYQKKKANQTNQSNKTNHDNTEDFGASR